MSDFDKGVEAGKSQLFELFAQLACEDCYWADKADKNSCGICEKKKLIIKVRGKVEQK